MQPLTLTGQSGKDDDAGLIKRIEILMSWIWRKATTAQELFEASCDLDALKIQAIVGGDIITISNKLGSDFSMGPVRVGDEFVSGWFYHKAVRVGDMMYDRLTGLAGMNVEDYMKLFDQTIIDYLLFK